jgi:drug/metabolite transporter (DMT)-like permease
MHQAEPRRKISFVLTWGLLWGFGTASLATAWDFYRGELGSVYAIIGRALIFIALGPVFGFYLWEVSKRPAMKRLPRSQAILRTVLFIALMVGLAYVLYRTKNQN